MPSRKSLLAHARKFHDEAIVIDGHNDHFWRKVRENGKRSFAEDSPGYQSDALRLGKGGLTAEICMVGDRTLPGALATMERARREIEDNPDMLAFATRTADIRKAKREGKLAVLFSWEFDGALHDNLEILRAGFRLGVRVSTITYNEGGAPFLKQGSPTIPCYCTPADRDSFRRTARGLTPFGKKYVSEMNRLGMLVDAAHANDKTFYEILDLSSAPVVSTHGGVFSLCPHSRCSTDDQIRALAESGGLLAISFVPTFLDKSAQKAAVDRVVDHIAYVAELVGADYVALGSDYDGMKTGMRPAVLLPDGLPRLTDLLFRRGFAESEIRKILGGNFLRVLKKTIG